MKFSKKGIFLIIILFGAIYLPQVVAQSNRDYMRETGKINVVTATMLTIFLGILFYLIYLNKRLTNIEHHIKDNDNERKN